jgi:hypothetical protein
LPTPATSLGINSYEYRCENRKRAEEALVALRSEQGELSSYKHLDDFTPEDCMNRIRAEMRRMEWLLERQTRRNALLRSTAF